MHQKDLIQALKNALYTEQQLNFDAFAKQIFTYQADANPIYQKYLKAINFTANQISQISDIPCLPIIFFKNQQVVCTDNNCSNFFESSGTNGISSKHFYDDISWYDYVTTKGIEKFYPDYASSCIIGLLPNYLERTGSSLIRMVDELIKVSDHEKSGFYLYDHDKLHVTLTENTQSNTPTILIGVSFALLDFAEQYTLPQNDCITIMETGGMKGKRKEIIRAEMHDILQQGFGVNTIHSEYGMTELFSQGYSKGKGIFECTPTMRVFTTEINDPFTVIQGKAGVLNVIDLANIHICAFIQTSDIGKVYADGTFEVLGRLDNSDIRGCNLMVG